jgi:anti-sigma B factor antagonist
LDFVVDVDSRGDYSVVRVCGEVDLYTSPMLDSCLSNLINSEKSLIAVDLSDCSYFDSDGIKTLVKWSRRLGEDGEFVVCGASGAVSRAFKICGLDSVIPILPSVEAAVQL